MTDGDPGGDGPAGVPVAAGRVAGEQRALAALALLRGVAAALDDAPDGPGGRAGLDALAAALVGATGCGWSASWAAVAVIDEVDDVGGARGPGGALRVAGAAGVAGAGAVVRGVLPASTAGPWPPDALTTVLLDRLGVGGERPVTALAVTGRAGPLGLLLLGTREPVGGLGEVLLGDVVRRLAPELALARGEVRERALARALGDAATYARDVPGLDVWTHAGSGWHDVLPLGDGSVGLAVGEERVKGGRDPAGGVGQVRSLLRAYADERAEPASVVMRVDQLVEGARIPYPVGLLYGRLSPLDGGAWEWAWSGVGSAAPLVVRPGTRDTDGTDGGDPVLEVLGDDPAPIEPVEPVEPVEPTGGPRTTDTAVLGPGDVLVLGAAGLAGRGRHLARADAAGVGEQVLAALVGAAVPALVVVRVPWAVEEVVPEPEGTPRQRRWLLPGEPSSIARARRHVIAACGAWGLPAVPQAELVVSELVANAVLHGWGPVGLRLRHGAQGLLVEVDDANPGPPLAPPHEPVARPGGYGLRVVARLAEWGWNPSDAGKTVWALLPVGTRRAG